MKTSSKWFVTAGAALFLAACGNGESEENTNDVSSGEANDTEEQQTVEVETMNGDMIEVPVNPEKVISFDHGVTDSIRAIGGDISGIPMGSNVPEYLQELESSDVENIGSLFEPDFEKIYEMDPDVIFISGRASDNYEELSEIAPTVFLQVDNQNFMETFERNMSVLGEIFDASEEVDSQLAEINNVIENVQGRAAESEANALIVSIDEGSASAYGIGSRFGIIHDVMNIPAADEDIPAEGHGSNVSNEYFSKTNPDYIFAIDRGASIGNSATADQVLGNEEVQRTNAYQDDNIYQLNSEVWYLSGSGLESVKMIVDEINAAYEQ